MNGGDLIRDLKTGTDTPVAASLGSLIWLDNDTVAGLEYANDFDAPNRTSFYWVRAVVLVGMDGKLRKRVVLHRAPQDRPAKTEPQSAFEMVRDSPRFPDSVVLSSVHRDFSVSYRARLADGSVVLFLDGQAPEAWSPDGQRYCAAPSRSLSPYGHDGREVYVAPLFVGRVHSTSPRRITPLLVYVAGADWR
jgi:hypothetical protein